MCTGVNIFDKVCWVVNFDWGLLWLCVLFCFDNMHNKFVYSSIYDIWVLKNFKKVKKLFFYNLCTCSFYQFIEVFIFFIQLQYSNDYISDIASILHDRDCEVVWLCM